MWDNNTIEDEIQRNSLEYGISVNSDRAIPDAKSGVKPVVKRILFDMFINTYLYSKPHVKSAKVYGDVMGRFHPHGDSSIYGAMVRLTQNWVLRYPLIDGHGNFGNIMGDGPAAGRYTEVRLTKLAEEGMLSGLKKKNVDFIPTYDESEEEPITLPAIFPNLLCNPNEGIGWAMGCSWAPHNLREVRDAIVDYLAGKEPMLPGPDFPTGGIVINSKEIPNIMRTGHGSVKIRGRYNIEKQNIVFYELPYGTRLEALMTEIGAAADEGKITNIVDVRNETSAKKGIRLVIEVEKGITPEKVVKQLFSKTNLQTSFSYNQVALVGKTPTELNLKQAIEVYVNHNLDCIIRETKFDKKKAEDRLHIVDGLLKALEDIDNIIALIKKSSSAAVAKDALIEKYSFSEAQAKAILDMRLAKLANLEKIELQNEKSDLEKKILEYNHILSDVDYQKDILKERLNAIVDKYGDDRRTELTNIEIKPEEKEIAEVVPEDVVVITTTTGLIKKVPKANFKVQRKGGVGVKAKGDPVLDIVSTNTIDTMMFFTDKGKMYRTIVDNIPNGTNATRGTMISDLVKLDNNEKVIGVTSLHRTTIPKYAIFITKQGMFKKTFLDEYMKMKKNGGLIAIKLKENDEVANIIFMDEEEMMLVTKKGMSIRFDTASIGAVGRVAMGIKGIKLDEGDEVITALPVHKNTDDIAVFAEDGMGKKTALSEFPTQQRGGKGVRIYKNCDLVSALMVSEEDKLLVVGNKSSICISATDITSASNRVTVGSTIIKNNRIVSVAKI